MNLFFAIIMNHREGTTNAKSGLVRKNASRQRHLDDLDDISVASKLLVLRTSIVLTLLQLRYWIRLLAERIKEEARCLGALHRQTDRRHSVHQLIRISECPPSLLCGPVKAASILYPSALIDYVPKGSADFFK